MPPESIIVKLDIGCGPNKQPGFVGCDLIKFENVDYVFNAGRDKWPFPDNSVDEIYSAHFLEHLTNLGGAFERVWFFNEAYRVLKENCKLQVIFPHWASNRYYGDPTHKEPFSEMGFSYLDKEWRKNQAPHTDSEFFNRGYSCNFKSTYGYNLDPALNFRNEEFKMFAAKYYKEACTDIIGTCVKVTA